MASARNFFSKQEKEELVACIHEAESNTSGEIRVHVDDTADGDVLKRAWQVFARLGMHKTAQRNGVLIYLAVRDRQFAIVGDEGINKVVPEGFWDETKNRMEAAFREGRFLDGLKEAILMAGEKLKTYFPHKEDDVNELPDDISFD